MNQFKLFVVILSAIAFCEVLQSETMIAKIKKMNQTKMLVDMKNTQGFNTGAMASNKNNYRNSESFRHPSSNYTEKRSSFFGHIGKNAWGKVKFKEKGYEFSRSIDHDFSFGIGYAKTSEHGNGYFIRLTSSKYNSTHIKYLEFNITNAVGEQFYGIYGLGVASTDFDGAYEKTYTGITAQWGAGVNLNHHFGIEFLAHHSYFNLKLFEVGGRLWHHELRLGLNFYF